MKNSIKQAIARQQHEAFALLTFAAKSGDVEVVRDLVRRGANINAVDYDGRTAFAMVAALLAVARMLCAGSGMTWWPDGMCVDRLAMKGVTRLWSFCWKREWRRIPKTGGGKLPWRRQLAQGQSLVRSRLICRRFSRESGAQARPGHRASDDVEGQHKPRKGSR